MATYTPNLNLGKPEDTDAFGNFRQLFNDNMDILDNGGGGGSGGHTIVNPSGSDMPAESKLQFTGGVTVTDDSVNGKTVVDISGGGGNVYGAFIDTNRVLATYNSSGGSAIPSYTALEDCFVAFYVFGKNSQTCRIYVNSAEILTVYFQGDGVQSPTLYLKKGQTLSFSSFDYWSFHYEVYGLTQGTNGIFTPIIYSDNERVVGVWRDNKPLYAKTYVLTVPNATGNYSFNEATPNLENVVHTEYSLRGIGERASTPWYTPATILFSEQTASYIEFYFESSYNAGQKIYFTSYYTKTTDVAGSGNWNTDGVPTVHYSTSEQVIGTWIDGKPLYEKTINYGALPSTPNIERDVNHGIPDVDTIWIADGFATNGTFVNQLNLSGVNNAEWFFGVTATYIRCMAQSDRSNYSAYVVLRYTKTTD